jgi:hypothetical protein
MIEKAKEPKKSKTYLVLIVVSLAYIGVYYLLMKETKECDPSEVFIRDHWFHGFWDQYLACRSINELGDALAGAFAPVAFMWLAGTVFIQSQELLAQRQELDETQAVMREQLAVAREQVEETRASTGLFRQQTEILEFDHQKRLQDAANKEFDADLNFVLSQAEGSRREFRLDAYKFAPGVLIEGNPAFEVHSNLLIPDSYRLTNFERLTQLLIIRTDNFSEYFGTKPDSPSIEYRNSESAFLALSASFNRLKGRIPNLSPDYQIRAKELRIELAALKLDDFLRRIDEEYKRFAR